MKKTLIFLIILTIIIFGSIYHKNNQNKTNDIINNNIKKDNIKTDIKEESNTYEDDNPIKLGLYKYYGRYKNRELVTEYNDTWTYHKDISSFEVFFTFENSITGNNFQDTFKNYYDKYENIDNYKIGYKISFITNNGEINKMILSPKDTEEFYEYLEVYLYDDYHREKGVWYSHTTEEEYNDNTLLTSIKLTAGINIKEIISDISLSAFTYDYDDFDENNNYRGISKYSIIVKNNNV